MRGAWLGFALALALALACGAARADTPIALFKSFAGNVNFVGTQQTMRTKANSKDPCAVMPSTANLKATLSGIPAGATILSAQLYWAGSNSSADTTVKFEGADVPAPAGRQYFSGTIGSGFDYFGGAADVTAQVAAKGNGNYSFSGLSINSGAPYCAVEGVIGGFALLVVYSDPGEQFRVLNLYEGFQFIRYSGITLTLSNFRTPNPLGAATGRVAHITWEGDGSLGANGEDLLFNGVEMYDSMNPKQNQFNSASNINNDSASYGIDFDAYTVGSSVISGGQTSVATRYQSGQDLVLLNAEIIAMPNVPTADLSIDMIRNTALVPGRSATYTLNVSNAGPNVETGPVVVTDTLPTGLAYVSASGTGWSCSIAGSTLTCSHVGSLPVGASLPALIVNVQVNGSGTLTNTASVAGKLFDNVSANSSDSDTAATESAPGFAFTDSACVNGEPFGTPLQTCKQLAGAPVTAGATAQIFVTALSGGVPTRLSASKATTVVMTFGLSCLNPVSHAGRQATFAGVPLPLCASSGAVPSATPSNQWSTSVNMVFAPAAPSAIATAGFVYADVGKVQLYLRDDTNNVTSAVPFVSAPASLAITSVIRADGVGNPAAATGAGAGFAKTGEAFTVTAAALTKSGAPAPNFGNESTAGGNIAALLTLKLLRGGDAVAQAAMAELPKLAGIFTSIVGGVFTGDAFSVDEAGIMSLTPELPTPFYLGALVTSASTNVGRFYPDHFNTIATSTLQCLPHMSCPAAFPGAAYSAQPFGVTVKPMNAADVEIKNYKGVLAREITLSAYSQAGGAVLNPAGGVLASNKIAEPAIVAAPVYSLPQPFSNSFPRARNWTAPTAIYLRAGAEEDSNGIARVSSLRASDSVEGGIMIVSGRLALENPHGSELMKMPVRASAQYWTSSGRWEMSGTDNVSTVQSGGITFANCTGKLKDQSKVPPKCDAAVLKVTVNSLLTLQNGATTFWLAAPGATHSGSAQFQMNNPAWLPSTIGSAVFGVYKSPLIYLREVY